MDKLKSAIELIKKFMAERLYGRIEIRIQDGVIIHLRSVIDEKP